LLLEELQTRFQTESLRASKQCPIWANVATKKIFSMEKKIRITSYSAHKVELPPSIFKI